MSGRTPEHDTGTRPDDRGDAAPVRFVIDGGGTPGDDEIAALVVALTPVDADAPDPGVDAWRRAALSEGVGGPRVLAPADLDAAVHDRWG